ncbi:alpha/beta fold hydrolase [Actinomyces faecalis]|uniref:alpha/beta fold hydrolase n=1 Tax=Actinomyces faecalis TaxID=2722820 RepID=UPI001551BD3F|nr:alpha/beta hydrolase [Actinomyces faecalis]
MLLLNGAGLVSGGWRRVWQALPEREIVTVDRPGYHGTIRHDLPTLPGEVRVLTTALDRLALGPVTVVAHSMAAFQAEVLARLRPGLVHGVVLVDPSLLVSSNRRPGLTGPLWQAARHGLSLRPVRHLARRGFQAGLRAQTHRPHEVVAEEWAGAWDSRAALAAGAGEWLSYGQQADDLDRLRRRQDAPAATCAVVLQAPPYASRAQKEALRQAFVHVTLHEVPDSRHLMMLDAPAQIVAAIRQIDRGPIMEECP